MSIEALYIFEDFTTLFLIATYIGGRVEKTKNTTATIGDLYFTVPYILLCEKQ